MDSPQSFPLFQVTKDVAESKGKKGNIVKRVFQKIGKKRGGIWQEESLEKGGKEEEEEEEGEMSGEGKGMKPKGKSKREKKSKKTFNPFSIPPSKTDFDLFKIRNPFIGIVMSDEGVRLEEDKVMDGRNMDGDALFAAMAAMVPQAIRTTKAFLQPSSESGGRPFHISVASGFKMVTRPRSTSEEILTTDDIVTRMAKSCEKFPLPSLSTEEEDLLIDVDEKDVILTGGESVENLDIKHEGDEGELKANEIKYDLSFMVYDKRIEGQDKKVTKLIVDCKWEEVSIKGICQVSTYGQQYAMSNMEKGIYSPIYLEVWGERLWRYAILFPKGIVTVEDGKVKATSGSRIAIHELQKILSSKEAEMRKRFQDAVYPDESYVHGVLYISRKKMSLPNFSESCDGDLDDVKLFYQSKIRILVGDKSLEWNEADVKAIVAVRQEEERRAVADYLRARRKRPKSQDDHDKKEKFPIHL